MSLLNLLQNLTDEMKNQVLQIALNEAGQLGSDSKINGIEAFDLNGDGVKEILISLNYRKDLEPFGQLRILTWNGQTYKSKVLNSGNDICGEKNFIVKNLANNEKPQIITWWVGGNKAFLHVMAQVINNDNSFSTVWEKDGIIGGSLKTEKDSIAIYSNGNIVQYYPVSRDKPTESHKDTMKAVIPGQKSDKISITVPLIGMSIDKLQSDTSGGWEKVYFVEKDISYGKTMAGKYVEDENFKLQQNDRFYIIGGTGKSEYLIARSDIIVAHWSFEKDTYLRDIISKSWFTEKWPIVQELPNSNELLIWKAQNATIKVYVIHPKGIHVSQSTVLVHVAHI